MSEKKYKINMTLWEVYDEYIIDIDNKIIGGTLTKQEAWTVKTWLGSAIYDIEKILKNDDPALEEVKR